MNKRTNSDLGITYSRSQQKKKKKKEKSINGIVYTLYI